MSISVSVRKQFAEKVNTVTCHGLNPNTGERCGKPVREGTAYCDDCWRNRNLPRAIPGLVSSFGLDSGSGAFKANKGSPR
jgi:hypothetical protein